MNQYIPFLKKLRNIFSTELAGGICTRTLASVLMIVAGVVCANAFTASKYAERSVLSTGRWIKVSVPSSGLYAITPAQLKQWGFTDASLVRVCGYGGSRIPDHLSSANYIDDVPVVPTFRTSSGNIVFYGVGPETWASSVTGRYSRSSNIYTTEGYYFLTQVEPGDTTLVEPVPESAGRPGATNPGKSFWMRLHHEKDLISPGQAGPHLVGEDFRLTKSREFSFDLTDRVDEDMVGVWFETSFVAKTYGQASTLTFTANGETVPMLGSDKVPATISDIHYHGSETITRHTLTSFAGDKLNLKITHESPTTVQGAWLNYISVNYQRKLQLDADGQLMFWSNSSAQSLGNVKKGVHLLDVTTPQRIYNVDAGDITSDARLEWTGSFTGWRTYVAFNDDARLPSPTYAGPVASQDLHGLASESVPDMVIVCHPSMVAQARRIASLHATDEIDPLEVQVVEAEKIYNEFASGMADVSALRKYFKMLWDKGADAAPEGYKSKFRYVILMGRASYDNRLITEDVKAFVPFVIPWWMGGTMRQSLNDTDGYGTDDFMALLKDNSGSDKGLDDLCISIGRIPVRTVEEAALYIDKLEQYIKSPKKTSWKNSVMFLADDGDNGRHMDQTESFIKNMKKNVDNPLFTNKVYLDSYLREGGSYPQAREAMFRLLAEGVVWWSFIGHANDHALTHNNQLTFNDLNNLFYKNVPVFYGATCDFLRWDQNSLSGGEIMFYERYGGAISIISATRPVYIYENGLLSNAMGRQLGARDTSGRLLTVGEIYRRAKNDILTDRGDHLSNPNRLRYVLMGDPAMRLATPSDIIDITEIDGKSLDNMYEDPVEIKALQTVVVKGVVRTPDGSVRSDFDGVVTVTLYDSEYSTTTHGYPDADTEGRVLTFEQQGDRLTAASAQVKNGEFEVTLSVPMDIADNYRPAAITTYAYATNSNAEAAGKTNNLYVYGFNDDADADTTAPVIESIYLNHESFSDGGITDASPMLIARVSDDVAINLSAAGIGHAMTVQLDGSDTYNDVSMYYTPLADGTSGGVINYPMSNLMPGEHTLRLRVFDTSANSATATVNFIVGDRVAPKIYDIYTDASPAYDKANFYISHDRPDQMATVTVQVYNLLGHPLWSRTVTGVSDLFTSTPVTWDLTDTSGRRVPRGIYLYRASITVDGETFDTGSRRLAVAAN